MTEFGISDTKAAMATYISELIAFRKATKLSAFIAHCPCTGNIPPDRPTAPLRIWSSSRRH